MVKTMAALTGLALVAALCIGSGCCSKPSPVVAYHRPALIFGTEPSAHLATRIARSPWPVTEGPYEGPQETYFVEYYRDQFGGNEFQERNNPQRQFRSYRIGMSQR